MVAALLELARTGKLSSRTLRRVTGQLTFYEVAFPRLRPLTSSLYATSALA